MAPVSSISIELNEKSCRLCLANDQEVSPIVGALTDTEYNNVIVKLLNIDINSCGPFRNSCTNCLVKIRLIEDLRNGFDTSNRLFGVLWTQYKRIHFPDSTVVKLGKQHAVSNVRSLPEKITHYIIDGVVVENADIEYDGQRMLIKTETDHDGIKQEHLDPDDAITESVEEELVYEEMISGDGDLGDDKTFLDDEVDRDHDNDDDNDGDDDDELVTDEEDLIDVKSDNKDHDEVDEEKLDDDDAEVMEGEEHLQVEALEEDVSGYFEISLHKCYICSDVLDDLEMLHDHLHGQHQDMVPFHCDKCLGYFETLEEVNKHYVAHIYPFVCLYCTRRYCTEELLVAHNKLCKSFRCPYCAAEFTVMAQLNAHKKQHVHERRESNRCKSCGRTFTQMCNLIRHMKSRRCGSLADVRLKKDFPRSADVEHRSPICYDSLGVNVRNFMVCPVCSKRCESNCNLARHIEREHGDFNFPLFSCDVCPKKFTTFEKCLRHRAFHRRSKVKLREPKKDSSDTVCKICGKQFRVDFQMLRHLAEEHSLSLELFHCDQCGRKFSTELKLRKHHYNSHRENKTLYVCSHCGQKFEKRLTLKDHETKHINAPAYKCDVCDKMFIHKHSLDRHALVHSDFKQFWCEYCSKRFKRQTTLTIHRRIHTGEKPYLCDPCGQRFIDSSTLIKHRQRFHPKGE